MRYLLTLLIAFAVTNCATAPTETAVTDAKTMGKASQPCIAAEKKYKSQFPANKMPTKATERISPEYPAAARAKGIEGCTLVVFDVINGQADNFKVIGESPAGHGFKEATLQALMGWKYQTKDLKNHYALFSYELAETAQ